MIWNNDRWRLLQHLRLSVIAWGAEECSVVFGYDVTEAIAELVKEQDEARERVRERQP